MFVIVLTQNVQYVYVFHFVFITYSFFLLLLYFYVIINRWALTHPLSVQEYEKLKKKQMKPDFLDMVPWYSGYILSFVCTYSSISFLLF